MKQAVQCPGGSVSILEAAAPIQSVWLGEGDEEEVYRQCPLHAQQAKEGFVNISMSLQHVFTEGKTKLPCSFAFCQQVYIGNWSWFAVSEIQ